MIDAEDDNDMLVQGAGERRNDEILLKQCLKLVKMLKQGVALRVACSRLEAGVSRNGHVRCRMKRVSLIGFVLHFEVGHHDPRVSYQDLQAVGPGRRGSSNCRSARFQA